MGEIFESQCAYYVSLGMDPVLYWNGDPALVRYYREAGDIQRRRTNHDLWLTGLYHSYALSAALSGFGDEPRSYLEEPLPLTETERIEQEERQAKLTYERLKNKFTAEVNQPKET